MCDSLGTVGAANVVLVPRNGRYELSDVIAVCLSAADEFLRTRPHWNPYTKFEVSQ